MAVHELTGQVGGGARDQGHRDGVVQPEAVLAVDLQPDLGGARVVKPEAPVEEPDERPDRAARVVVLGTPEQQGRASFEVPQVDVVAERGALDPPAGGDDQHHFRLGVVPRRVGMDADVRAGADRRHRLSLGEQFRIGAQPDLQVR